MFSRRYEVRETETVTGRTSSIEITAVQDEDYTTYSCTVVNSYGEDTAEIELDRKGACVCVCVCARARVGVCVCVCVLFRQSTLDVT